MDEIAQRLKTTGDNCVTCYEAWGGKKKDPAAREALLEAVHELRKVAARLEIEIAVSERDEMASRPLPIPPHRSSRKRPNPENEAGDAQPAAAGNGGQGGNKPRAPRRRRVVKGQE